MSIDCEYPVTRIVTGKLADAPEFTADIGQTATAPRGDRLPDGEWQASEQRQPQVYLLSSSVFSERLSKRSRSGGGLLRRPNRIGEHEAGQAILVLRVGVRN